MYDGAASKHGLANAVLPLLKRLTKLTRCQCEVESRSTETRGVSVSWHLRVAVTTGAGLTFSKSSNLCSAVKAEVDFDSWVLLWAGSSAMASEQGQTERVPHLLLRRNVKGADGGGKKFIYRPGGLLNITSPAWRSFFFFFMIISKTGDKKPKEEGVKLVMVTLWPPWSPGLQHHGVSLD